MMRALRWLLGLAGFLALLFVGVVYLLVEEPPTVVMWIGGGGGVAVALAVLLDWQQLKNLGEDQTVARSATAAVAVVMAGAIAITANVVAHRNDVRKDFTREQRFSLSDQSKELVAKLDQEVEVLAFFPGGSPEARNFEELMDEYLDHTTLLQVRYIDPYSDRVATEQNKVLSAAGTVILKAGENTQRLETEFDENAFTNALVRVTSTTSHSVCVVSGHGELDVDDDYSPSGLGIARIRLEGQNYTVSKRTLLQAQPSPTECEVLLLAGPRTELLPQERDRLAVYVAAGGNLVVLLDPLTVPETAADLARFGVKVGQDVVIEGDPNRQVVGGDPTYVVLDEASYDISPVTRKMRGVVVLPLARSVDKGPEIPGLNVQVIARASKESWGETNLGDTSVPAEPTPGTDLVGEVPMLVTVEVTDPAAVRTKTELTSAPTAEGAPPVGQPAASEPSPPPAQAGGRVMVLGDSDFAGNLYLMRGTNQDLLFNSIAWMVGEEDQISIRANEAQASQLQVDILSLLLAGGLSLVVVPGITIAGALGTWIYRRGR